jgi:hypothetical protein
MPVRDSSEWRHARLERKVINHDRGGTYVMCAWDTCERDGHENNKVVVQNGQARGDNTMTYVFCSERHKAYWLNNNRPGNNNNLPPGWKRSIL